MGSQLIKDNVLTSEASVLSNPLTLLNLFPCMQANNCDLADISTLYPHAYYEFVCYLNPGMSWLNYKQVIQSALYLQADGYIQVIDFFSTRHIFIDVQTRFNLSGDNIFYYRIKKMQSNCLTGSVYLQDKQTNETGFKDFVQLYRQAFISAFSILEDMIINRLSTMGIPI